MDRRKILKNLTFLVFFIFVLNFLAIKLYWYSAIWWFDMPMHFLGGFWLSLVFIYFFGSKQDDVSLNSILKIFFFVLFIGIGWEIFEVLINQVLLRNPFNLLDTCSDIFFDLSGGLCAILYIWKKQQIR